MSNSSTAVAGVRIPISIYALTLAAFAIGTTEFVIMGLLPQVADSLRVSIPAAGWLVSGYALGVALGAPVMALATARLPRKTALFWLMAIFVLGNALCALAANYGFLMAARVVTSLCHGAFFGIGSVVAANLAPPGRKASAMALMFTGLTVANILGVPLGTALGQAYGWRSTFWAVSGIGVLTLAGITILLPKRPDEETSKLSTELIALRNLRLWAGIGLTVLFSASMFTLFTYIAPLLNEVTGISPHGVTWTLLLVGVGYTIGNTLGGRLADWRILPGLAGSLAVIVLLEVLYFWAGRAVFPAELTLFLWGAASFAAAVCLQMNVITTGSAAPNLAATLNVGAFNAGNALGAWLGGLVIDHGPGLTAIPLVAALPALLALAITLSKIFVFKPRAVLAPVADSVVA